MKITRKIIASLMALALMSGPAAYTEETLPAPEATHAPAVEQVQENSEAAPAAEMPAPTAEVPVDEPAAPVDTPVEEPIGETAAEPTAEPVVEPAEEPTGEPVAEPTGEPAAEPTEEPAVEPTVEPTVEPADEPTEESTEEPAAESTVEPTVEPAEEPTEEPVVEPTVEPEVPAEEPAVQEVEPVTAYVNLQYSDSHLNVRAKPGMDAEIIGRLNHGDKVSVLAEEGEWSRISQGYVKSSYLSSSAPAAKPEAPAEEVPAQPAEKPAEEPAVESPAGEEAPAQPVSTEGLRQIIVTLVEGEESLPFYAEAGGEVIANIPAGAILHVKSVDSGYSYAVYSGMAGYVDTNKIALFNSEATEEEKEIIRSVSVSANVGSTPSHEGDQIILSAKLTGFEDVNYRLQWQYSPDGGATIIDVSGANDAQYSFIINDENAAYLWRVCVTILEATEEATA